MDPGSRNLAQYLCATLCCLGGLVLIPAARGDDSAAGGPGTPDPAVISRRIAAAPDCAFGLRISGAIQNRSVTISNVGTEMVVNPRLIVNGRRNWFSTPDILAGIIAPGMTDREKSLAIWR